MIGLLKKWLRSHWLDIISIILTMSFGNIENPTLVIAKLLDANVLFWAQKIILTNLIQNLMLVFFLAIQTQANLIECITKELWLWKNLYLLYLMSLILPLWRKLFFYDNVDEELQEDYQMIAKRMHHLKIKRSNMKK